MRVRSGRALVAAVNLLASVEFVWFYLRHVPSALDLVAYERGLERTPFQYRMLMMYPLRWARDCGWMARAAAGMNAMPGWFPGGVHAEGIVQAGIDLASIVVAGLVARGLYRRASANGLLTPYVYPLTLVMATSTYCLQTNHSFRFVYDLPSMAFFSVGMYLVYARGPVWLFVAVFAAGTVNRETTLFLLPLTAVSRCLEGSGLRWRRLLTPGTGALLVGLAGFWAGWHRFVVLRFAANPVEGVSRLSLNAGLLFFPITWPQMLGVFGYVLPVVVLFRRDLRHPVLRTWMWILPAWFGFMFYFGLLIEVRIFGELIPYMACVAALICEERLWARMSVKCSPGAAHDKIAHGLRP